MTWRFTRFYMKVSSFLLQKQTVASFGRCFEVLTKWVLTYIIIWYQTILRATSKSQSLGHFAKLFDTINVGQADKKNSNQLCLEWRGSEGLRHDADLIWAQTLERRWDLRGLFAVAPAVKQHLRGITAGFVGLFFFFFIHVITISLRFTYLSRMHM